MDILKLNIDGAEPETPSQYEVQFQISLLASLGATAAALAGRFGLGFPLVPEQLAQFIFSVAPISVVELAVGLLGPFAKHLAFLGCVLLYASALAGAGVGFFRLAGRSLRVSSTLAIAGLSVALWLVTSTIVTPLLGGGLFGQYLAEGAMFTSLSLAIVYGLYGGILWLLSKLYQRQANLSRETRTWLGRRRVIRGIGYAVLAVGAYDIGVSLFQSWLNKGSGRVAGGDGVFPNINGLAYEITPVSDFYTVSKNPFDPDVDRIRWTLEVKGLVENHLSLSWDLIQGLPSVEQYATLECIDNKVGGELIGNANWRGVRLREILNRAVIKPGVVDIVFRAADGYRDSVPLSRALGEGTILAYRMNGEPLTREHGSPLRLIVPGIYGMKNIKWVTSIEAVDFDFKGYWQSRGWDDRAEYKTMSRIDVPGGDVRGPATIAGIAFAGDRGISKVEVSTNGGRDWETAELKAALSPYSWVLWKKEWEPPTAGEYSIVVRATDGEGVTQTSRNVSPAPDGASGYHRARIEAGS